MMNESLLLSWINAVYKINKQTKQRYVIVLSGNYKYCIKTVKFLINELSYNKVMWISSEIEQAISPRKSRMLLGNECDVIVYDAYKTFDVDAFGAVSGTVKASGVIFLLLPDKENKKSYLYKSRFFKRVWSIINNHQNVYLLKQNNKLPPVQQNICDTTVIEEVDAPYRSVEQKMAVYEIVEHVKEKKRFAIVLTSNRGRGKSSALGISAGLLLKQIRKKIIVTAPRISNVEPVFYHANKVCEGVETSHNIVMCNDSLLEFMAPDALLEKKPIADVIFVDEASSIPLPMLDEMLDSFPKIIFSSTIHGYEGTGRGFALKFNKMLDAISPCWKKFELQTPIRWIKNDPVEKFVDSILGLNTELDNVDHLKYVDIGECLVNCIDRDTLVKNEEKLSSLFSLLVYAHYRTQPSDLAYMLDNDSIRIYTLEHNDKILAAALISEEGGFDRSLSLDVYKGIRRPQGHLLAQTLSFHAGIELAATLKYARVMRIAVHPELQNQGLGTFLLEQVSNKEQVLGMDVIGSSFGATVELMHFWNRLAFEPVRIGFTRDHASGTHSAIVLKTLNQESNKTFIEARCKFRSYIYDWLEDYLSDLPAELKHYLENDVIDKEINITNYEWNDIYSFVSTHRGYEACITPLRKLVVEYDDVLGSLDTRHQVIINAKIKNRKSWADVVKESEVSGKAEAIKCLKESIGSLLKKIDEIHL